MSSCSIVKICQKRELAMGMFQDIDPEYSSSSIDSCSGSMADTQGYTRSRCEARLCSPPQKYAVRSSGTKPCFCSFLSTCPRWIARQQTNITRGDILIPCIAMDIPCRSVARICWPNRLVFGCLSLLRCHWYFGVSLFPDRDHSNKGYELR